MTHRTIVVLMLVTLPLAGCTQTRDVIASLIGAPTSDQIAAAQDKVDEAVAAVDDLTIRAEDAEERAAELEGTAATTETQKAEVRSLYGRMAAELPNLEGAAADAMVETLDGLQAQLRGLKQQGDAGAELAASYRRQAQELNLKARQNEAKLEQANAELLGFKDATDAAVAGVADVVNFAGETAASLGVPAARETASKVREGLAGGLAVLFGTGGLVAGRTARKRRKERDEEAHRRTLLGKVVTASAKFGLVGGDETARAGAKEWAGPEAHLELKKALIENGHAAAA